MLESMVVWCSGCGSRLPRRRPGFDSGLWRQNVFCVIRCYGDGVGILWLLMIVAMSILGRGSGWGHYGGLCLIIRDGSCLVELWKALGVCAR